MLKVLEVEYDKVKDVFLLHINSAEFGAVSLRGSLLDVMLLMRSRKKTSDEQTDGEEAPGECKYDRCPDFMSDFCKFNREAIGNCVILYPIKLHPLEKRSAEKV